VLNNKNEGGLSAHIKNTPSYYYRRRKNKRRKERYKKANTKEEVKPQ